jgi:hypothetical protein
LLRNPCYPVIVAQWLVIVAQHLLLSRSGLLLSRTGRDIINGSALKEGAVNAAVAVEPAAGAVTVRLAAYVHRSDGRPGFDPGSGWSRKMFGPAVRTNIATDRTKE